MTYNPNAPMNDLMRRAGSRSRGTYTAPTPAGLPNIGQTPAVLAANQVLGQSQMPGLQPTATPAPAPTMSAPPPMAPASPAASAPSPMAAPNVQPSTFTLHPPGIPADPNQYTYEPQPDGAWRVYPPGVAAPGHTLSASLPRAASTADYRKMSQAFTQFSQAPAQAASPPPAPLV